MLRLRPRLGRLAGLVALTAALAGAAAGQDDTPAGPPKPAAKAKKPAGPVVTPARPAPGPAAGADTTLYLMLRTGPDETEKKILDTITTGVKLTAGGETAAAPAIRSLSPGIYAELTALVNQAVEAPVAADDGNEVTLRPLPSRDARFEVKVAPTQVVKKFAVTYARAGAKEYTPAARSKKDDSDFQFIIPGEYALRLLPDDVPQAYEATVGELGKPDAVVKGKWPVADKYFVVTVRGFRGNKADLFRVIQDGTKVANPLDRVQLGDDFLFAFANLNSSAGDPEEEETIVDSALTLAAKPIPKRSAARVWALFPLDEAAAKAELVKYAKFGGAELSAEIRKANPVRAGGAVPVVGPATPAKWYELTPAGPTRDARLTRTIQLDDVPESGKKYPTMWSLRVWEFDAGTGKPEAIQVVNPAGDRVYVLDRENFAWRKAAKSAPKKAGPPDAAPAPQKADEQ